MNGIRRLRPAATAVAATAVLFIVLNLVADPVPSPAPSVSVPRDTAAAAKPQLIHVEPGSQPLAGSGASAKFADTSKTTQTSKELPAQKIPPPPPLAKSRADSVRVVKHEFNHRQQIITGSVIMSCLALIMVTMNNYNPR